VNVANLTGGVLSAENLFTGDNFACFAFQLLEQGIPDFASKILNALDPVTSLVNKYVGPVLGGLACPQLGQFDNVSSVALSRDVRKAFTNASDLCRASLISSLAATTTRLGLTPTTSKCNGGCRGELVSLQKSARLCRGYYSGILTAAREWQLYSIWSGTGRIAWKNCLYRTIDSDGAISTINITYKHLEIPPLMSLYLLPSVCSLQMSRSRSHVA
jgi:hypothetical protein